MIKFQTYVNRYYQVPDTKPSVLSQAARSMVSSPNLDLAPGLLTGSEEHFRAARKKITYFKPNDPFSYKLALTPGVFKTVWRTPLECALEGNGTVQMIKELIFDGAVITDNALLHAVNRALHEAVKIPREEQVISTPKWNQKVIEVLRVLTETGANWNQKVGTGVDGEEQWIAAPLVGILSHSEGMRLGLPGQMWTARTISRFELPGQIQLTPDLEAETTNADGAVKNIAASSDVAISGTPIALEPVNIALHRQKIHANEAAVSVAVSAPKHS